MSTDTHENAADLLVTLIEDVIAMPGKPNKPKLEKMRGLAIDAFNMIQRLEQRVAYQERDGRESYLTMKILKAAGLVDDEQYTNANRLVTEARSPNNVYTDVDTILKRNREEMKNETSNQK